jgi:16S rRNA processing protein RimM
VQTKLAKAVPGGAAFCAGLTIGGHLHIINAAKKRNGAAMKQYLEVGLLNNTHGVRGEMKLTLWCDDLDYLRRFQVLYLDPEGQHPLHVTALRPQKQGAIIRFAEITSIEQAETIKGKVSDIDKMPEGRTYIQDLLGCLVIDADSGAAYGTITDVQNYGSCDIYDVQKGKAHTLVPAIDDVVVEKDVAAGVVKIRPMKGLFDAD